MIVQYVKKRRHNHTRRVGVLVALKKDGKIHIGWSKCSNRDTFNRHTALQLAEQRATGEVPQEFALSLVNKKHMESPTGPPRSIEADIVNFAARAIRYFKSTDLEIAKAWPNYYSKTWTIVPAVAGSALPATIIEKGR